jgi:nitrile hydratase
VSEHEGTHGHGHATHGHDHAHAPITNGEEPVAAERVGALEQLLVEKGVISREDVRERIDWLVSRSPADGARLVARAWVDPEFKERLLADARGAALELGLDPGPSPVVVALENTATVHHMVVCTLCSCYPKALLGPPPDWYKSFPYRSRAVSDPRGVLSEFGVELEGDVEVRVVDSTAEIRYLVIPRRPAGSGEMSERELAALVTRDSMIGVAQPSASAPIAS